MTFGFGTPRDQTLVADLEHLEPRVQHVNGSVPGIAPDAYYMLIRRWVARRAFRSCGDVRVRGERSGRAR